MYTPQHYIHGIYAIMFYRPMIHDYSYKLYIESKAKQAISLKRLVGLMYDACSDSLTFQTYNIVSRFNIKYF